MKGTHQRIVIFQLVVILGNGLSYILIPHKVVREEDLVSAVHFDALVAKLKEVGCEYQVVQPLHPIHLDGNTKFDVTPTVVKS